MNIEYHHWYSPRLNQEMELKVYGHAGKPILVFPAQGGRFFEFEDFGMVDAASWFIETGKVQLYTVDSIDNQSWANFGAHPHDRGRRHEDYDGYIVQEVAPFIRQHSGYDAAYTTGCSMGGYHACNFYFRHPDVFNGMLSISGLTGLSYFVGDYSDEHVYFNSPLMYLAGMEDPWFLDRYRSGRIVFCAGQGAWEEMTVRELKGLQWIMDQKGIPYWADYWGFDVNHDWPWWRKMFPFHLSKMEL